MTASVLPRRWNAVTCCLLLGSLTFSARVDAQPPEPAGPEGKFVDHIYRDVDGEHRYVVFEPLGYTPDKKWPVVFYLHGASGRGVDGRAQLVVGLGPAVKARAATFPFLVVFPQNENLRSRLLGGWTDGSRELPRALEILDDAEKKYSVDTRHRILCGVSMGAFGAWSVAASSPEKWKGVIAVSGGGEPDFVPALTKVPVWAFHALDDQLVPPSRSTDLVAAINKAGGRAYVSLLNGGGHNIGAQVLARDEVFSWMEHPESIPPETIDWSQRSRMADMTDEVPFVPGADVAGAGRMRVNGDLLESLSYVIADRVPASALQGWKPGRFEQQQTGFSTINVAVGDMHYDGRLEHARLTPLANGQLRVQLGLRALTMTITGTRLQGRLLNAQAGPMTIYIGHAEPVWLTVDVLPQVVDRQLKLFPQTIDFTIPHHNWSISRPGVNVRGLPFLEGRIADRLVEGIAEKKWTIEQEIRSSVPQLVGQIETRIATMWDRTMTYRQWPMPLWQPRFRFYPESVVVDEHGMELRLGATVAALAPKSKNIPIRPFPALEETFPVAKSQGLDVAMSMRLVDAYATLLSASDVARFHVLDMNGAEFRKLGTREFWNSILPPDQQFPENTELNTEFVLAEPFQVRPAEAGAGNGAQALSHKVALNIRQMQLQLATRQAGETEYRDRLTADFSFAQPMALGIDHASHSIRKMNMQMEPIGLPDVKVRWKSAEESAPIDEKGLAEQFHKGWTGAFGRTDRDRSLADIKMGQFAVRWDDLGVTDHHFVVRMKRPGIRVHNSSEAAIEYTVRSSSSPWSEMLRLEPGKSHEFQAATPLTWRSTHNGSEMVFTLPIGFDAQAKPDRSTGELTLYEWVEKTSAQ